MNIILLPVENKCSSPSSIPVKLLKIASLCKLIYHSLITVIFHDAVKITKFIPIFKDFRKINQPCTH